MLTRRKLQITLALTFLLAMLIPVTTASAQELETLEGTITIRDAAASDFGSNDSLGFDVADVPILPASQEYEGWLVASDGSRVSIGSLMGPNLDGEWVSPEGENLAATYVRFYLSVEPDPDPDPATPGTVAYTGTTPSGILVPFRALLTASSVSPEGSGILVALRGQAQTALTHANLASDSTTIEDQQTHAQHVINVIDGLGAPGDGVGITVYANEAIVRANQAKAAAPGDERIIAAADALIAAVNVVTDRANIARDNAQSILAATNPDSIAVEVGLTNVRNMSQEMIDYTGDGYLSAQDIGAWQLTGGAGGALPGTGDELVPMIAMLALLGGIVLTGGGVLMLRRRPIAA